MDDLRRMTLWEYGATYHAHVRRQEMAEAERDKAGGGPGRKVHVDDAEEAAPPAETLQQMRDRISALGMSDVKV